VLLLAVALVFVVVLRRVGRAAQDRR